jgi:hypothetical protein
MAFRDQFEDFVDVGLDETAEPKPWPREPKSPLSFDLSDWDAKAVFVGDAPPQEWLVSGSVPRRVAGIIAAAGDTGKSFTAMELCLRVTRGPIGGLMPEYPILGGLVQSYAPRHPRQTAWRRRSAGFWMPPIPWPGSRQR